MTFISSKLALIASVENGTVAGSRPSIVRNPQGGLLGALGIVGYLLIVSQQRIETQFLFLGRLHSYSRAEGIFVVGSNSISVTDLLPFACNLGRIRML